MTLPNLGRMTAREFTEQVFGELAKSDIGRKLVDQHNAKVAADRRSLSARYETLERELAAEMRRLDGECERAETAWQGAQKAEREARRQLDAATHRRFDKRGNYEYQLAQLREELVATHDPRIDAFIAELRRMLEDSLSLLRTWRLGLKDGTGGDIVVGNREQVDALGQQIIGYIKTDAERLKARFDEDLDAAIDAIRQRASADWDRTSAWEPDLAAMREARGDHPTGARLVK